MYQEFFGLSGKPFQLSPDASFFYASREHKRALAFLEYGLAQADGFIVVTGDVGTGKSTLAQTLLQKLDPKRILVANIVTTLLKEDDLLHLVAANLGLRVTNPSKAILLRELERLFQQQAREGRRVLILVDEAQNLPPGSVEELRMLSNFTLNSKPLVQIFLLGQQEFRETLLGPGFEQLRQRVIATYHLNPLDEAETRTYIEHRLRRVGWNNRPAFSDDAFTAIYRFCSGVPRRINNLCDRLMLYAFLEEQTQIDGKSVQSVSEEIGSEFWTGRGAEVPRPRPPAHLTGTQGDASGSAVPLLTDAQGFSMEILTRSMFDRASIQQRLGTLERGIDGLGQSLKPEIAELREEMAHMRALLEALLLEVRTQKPSTAVMSNPIPLQTTIPISLR
ncbi:MAG: XrtA/PEP-CTERM system-associated ATPase [Gammaproteobacteria bacterium]